MNAVTCTKRAKPKSPVRENRTPGTVRGLPGDRQSYLDDHEMIERKAIRAIMLTPEGRILLMQAQEPSSDFTVWFAPGGGIESNEMPEECLRREIEEETGVVLKDIGPVIWRRHQ